MTVMTEEMANVQESLRAMQQLLQAQWQESVDLERLGYRVPVAWLSVARDVFDRLCTSHNEEGLPIRRRWLWKLHSIEEHLRYFVDQDLEWSVVWAEPSTQATRLELLSSSRTLLARLEGMTDEEVQDDIEWEREKGLR